MIALARKSWSEMSVSEKRVAVARDVIFQIETGTYIPTAGKYLDTEDWHMPVVDVQCRCCAIGGMFVSLLRLMNRRDENGAGASEIYDELATVFSRDDIKTIEQEFEGWPYHLRHRKVPPRKVVIDLMNEIIDRETKPVHERLRQVENLDAECDRLAGV